MNASSWFLESDRRSLRERLWRQKPTPLDTFATLARTKAWFPISYATDHLRVSGETPGSQCITGDSPPGRLACLRRSRQFDDRRGFGRAQANQTGQNQHRPRLYQQTAQGSLQLPGEALAVTKYTPA